MADTKLADLTALTTTSDDDLLYVVDNPAGTPADRKLALSDVFKRGTVSTSSPVIDAAQTWNASGVTFTGLRFNATDTASAAASLLMDLQVGGTSQFRVSKAGRTTLTDITLWSNETPGGTTTKAIWAGPNATVILGRGGTAYVVCAGNGFGFPSANTLGWGYTSSGGTADLEIGRRAAANLRLGAADAAAPVAQTLSVQSVVAGTTNTAGANLTITGSQGTGTGAGGSIIFQVAPAGSSGTAQNALSDALTIQSNGGFRLGGSTAPRIYPQSASIINFDTGNIGSPTHVFLAGSVRVRSDASSYMLGASDDVIITRDAANTLALRNGTNAQELRWYRTFTDASNRQNGALKTAASEIIIEAQTAGTGADDIDVTLTPAGTGNVRFGTHTATSDTAVSGYIEIKDAGGTIRKLAVIT